ncbi:hypothetical protein H072_6524 [Dactylellina haptotyla CBS 200.50]|uniref:Helicase ATP-binding domain-containing protein n=1 Tax=Dactylellina haptotyla (strain CBS 200.50) TaxID=1284197 RepID=S8BWJ0_DACHA|nr:hypothetical protein H072_6524 [Dactylellina haptotyla CBS 200.50]
MSEPNGQGRPSGRGNVLGRGRGGGYRGNKSQKNRQSAPAQRYGIDPEDIKETPEATQQNRKPPNSGSSSHPKNHNQHPRGNFYFKRGNMQQTMHNRPPLQIAGHPERQSKRTNGDTQQQNHDRSGDFMDNNGEMNAHLSERIISSKRPDEKGGNTSRYNGGVPKNLLVEQFERTPPLNIEGINLKWRALPEVPSSAELMAEEEVDIPGNEVEEPWESVDEYLGAHYELLREDCFSPLRESVGRFRADTTMDDGPETCIYENCRIVGFTFAYSQGICVKMSFSTNRARKRIRWENSKRLCPGTLVALTSDNFDKSIRVATVAARPIDSLNYDSRRGLEVDLLLLPEELEIDPTKTWIMVESRSSYFEAYKHVLKALQRMEIDFPLHHILTLQEKEIRAPKSIVRHPNLDLTPCFNDQADTTALRDVNVLQKFPTKKTLTTSMDETQLEAVKRILTKELAVIQGPPGCGKTFVSVKALSVMLANKKRDDPPIVVACQTNHALDQLLRHVIEFEPSVIRLGGRTQDQDKIKSRTLYNVRTSAPWVEVQGSKYNQCKRSFRILTQKGSEFLELLDEGKMTPDVLLRFKIITQEQRNSFLSISDQWVKSSTNPDAEKSICPMDAWVGQYMVPVLRSSDNMIEFEEEDPAFEGLNDREEEFDEYDGKLVGSMVELRREKEIIQGSSGVGETMIEQMMKRDDVWSIPERVRPNIYARFQKAFMSAIENEMRIINVEYAAIVQDFKIARWEKDAYTLSKAKLIGMTTTGVSKYRSLVAALQPKICLIEEAAETLEGPLIAACYPSIQQLILVGDHKQLKGHCSVRSLEEPPYNLAVSMFERLVTNGVEFTMLNKQRRMRPEIREILNPIYPELEDDVQVLNKPPIPGMGSTNLYFCAHTIPEEQDELSKKNKHEAQMVVNLCGYLFDNGVPQSEITILTFYTGQVREIGRLLRQHPRLNDGKERVRVATVDSFQGEENEVVILSLCRSNNNGSIGFLNVPNRVCVALSRAKRGFYMFGNAELMSQVSGLWWDVLQIMNHRSPKAVSTALPLTCARHKKVTHIEHVVDWYEIQGGCKQQCGEYLECNHRCPLHCHPYPHEQVKCTETCKKQLKCGHICLNECWEDCACQQCARKRPVSSAHMDHLSERLAEVKTTDMMPAMLHPISRRKTAQNTTAPNMTTPNEFPPLPTNDTKHHHKKAPAQQKAAADSLLDLDDEMVAPIPLMASLKQENAKKEKEEDLLIFFDDDSIKTTKDKGNEIVTEDMNKTLFFPKKKGEGPITKLTDLLGDF